MALKNETDPARAQQQLTTWLARRLGTDDVSVRDVHIPTKSCLSAETLMFTASWTDGAHQQSRELVARVQPTGRALFPTYDLGAEFDVMRALSEHTAVPVPEVLFYEDDSAVLGAPFFVMQRIDGRVASDDPPFPAGGWVVELTPAEQATMCENALQSLAQIHLTDYEALGLEAAAKRKGEGDALTRELAYWEGAYRAETDDELNPTIEAALEWVKANRPTDNTPVVLNWGDARIGNVIFADDLSTAAVIDWEMLTIGPPELDLGWWYFILRHHTEGIGAPVPPGFPSRETEVQRYEVLTGHAVSNLDFYEVFAGLRLAILVGRAARIMVEGGLVPADSKMGTINPATRLLAQLIGAPAPDGQAEYYIGNR
jgi:aminoglycoside phosphotransferase (APT) family kinase protein